MPKSKEKNPEKPPKKQDQVVEAYYMLARVVSQNTQMYEAVFNALTQMSSDQAPEKPVTAENISDLKKEKLIEVLTQIVEKCGKAKAIDFLNSFDAETISDISPAHYEVFVKSGEYLIKHYQGDVI
jgi:hypothetical protein